MFQRRGNVILKGTTIKGKNMLPGSIFFPLKVALMRIENNFKGHINIKISQYVSLLKSPKFDAANILEFLQ